ncbi:MAG: GNAT family N-acetyltransferase, partial [Candidatus Aenigmarchaeota archaeon]|nr:GNAT family N-acetyltransferase [Candidatus Aenigmarchaeota archaeon]
HVWKIKGNTLLKKTEYEASGGLEIFLSYESSNALFGFLRLRLGEIARIRELHVYGRMVPISMKSRNAAQHKGLGRKLMEEAERIARENGSRMITVTSGAGVRGYYEKLGYRLNDHYMGKNLAV